MFAITDGFSTMGGRLAQVLRKADDEGVQVVGVSVGFDASHVAKCYKDWVVAALPGDLPKALRKLLAGEGEGDADADADVGADFRDAAPEPEGGDKPDLRAQKPVFGKLLKKLRSERQEALMGGGGDVGAVSVDICFVLDVTGSMAPYLKVCKAQVKAIATGVKQKIGDDCGIELHMRFAMVAYRDFDDGGEHLETLRFTEDAAELQRFVDRLQARGGGDMAEDVLGALQAASALEWKSKARFAVLVCDAPGHGLGVPRGMTDDHRGGRGGLKARGVVQGLVAQQVDLLMCRITEDTERMEQLLNAEYRDDAAGRALVPGKTIYDLTEPLQPGHAKRAGITTSYHYVFCLDESGSMSGSAWEATKDAYWDQFITPRLSGANDRQASLTNCDQVSVVTFNDTARVQHSCVPILSAPTKDAIDYKSGGTNFGPALEMCKAEFSNTDGSGLTPLLIFMSDGGGSGKETMSSVHAAHGGRGLQVHTIAFGSGASKDTLREMASLGGGRFHDAPTGVALGRVFKEISGTSKASQELMEGVGNEVSSMVSNKIRLDYL